MKPSGEIQAFTRRLGHEFTSPDLLIRALTHPSIATTSRPDNQRLEFLGDRVLGLIIAEALFEADASAAEGTLAPRYNALVRKETCADIARHIDLGSVLRLGRSEMKSGGRRKEALLADAMEAVIAAIYLDAGFDVAKATVRRLWKANIENVDSDARDPKSMLQEWAQSRKQAPPQYVEIARDGPDHAPEFTIEARLADGTVERAKAGSKRAAEMEAAQRLLGRLEP